MTTLSCQITPIILCIFFLVSNATPSPSATPKSRFTRIFAFGDSFTDTGNTESGSGPNGFSHVSQYPYGMTFFHRPTNRYSDGRLVIDFVTEHLSLPYLPPYKNQSADTSHGVNFAVAGSTATSYSFFVGNNLVLDQTNTSIETQLVWFKKFLHDHGCGDISSSLQCKALMTDSLFWVGEIGVNDNAYTIGSTVSAALVKRFAIQSVNKFLQELLSMGATNIVVQGMPPTGCLPLALTLALPDDRDNMGCVASSNKLVHGYNFMLQAKLQALRRQYPHAIISYANYWQAFIRVINNLHKYKFTEKFKTCCGTGVGPLNYDIFATCGSDTVTKACMNPAQFINWDGVHLTEGMYKVVANMFLRGGYIQPPLNL